MVQCCVKGCTKNSNESNKSRQSITFHRIPKDLIRRHKWARLIGGLNWVPTDHHVVCSLHFKRSNFYNSKGGLRRLDRTALPSFLLPGHARPDGENSDNFSDFNGDDPLSSHSDDAYGGSDHAEDFDSPLKTEKELQESTLSGKRKSARSTDNNEKIDPWNSDNELTLTIDPDKSILSEILENEVGSKKRRKDTNKINHDFSDDNHDDDVDIKVEQECTEEIKDEFNEEESNTTPARQNNRVKFLQNLKSSNLQKAKQIKILKQTIFRQKKRVSHLKGVLKDIKRGETAEIKKYNKLLILKEKNTNAVRNTLELRAFAVTLHFLSDKAYNYVHDVFKTTLPPEEEVYKWRMCFEESDSEEIKDIPQL